jgi:hypothetical protein
MDGDEAFQAGSGVKKGMHRLVIVEVGLRKDRHVTSVRTPDDNGFGIDPVPPDGDCAKFSIPVGTCGILS